MSSSENYHLFSDKSEEEMFIRRNLRFLLDCDDESETSVCFNSREEVCTYAKSSLDSSVLETWTTFFYGSLCSPREHPTSLSTLYTIAYVPAIPVQSVPVEYTRESLNYTFMTYDVRGHTSTPVRNRSEQNRDSYVQSYVYKDEVQVNSRRASIACGFAGKSSADSGYDSIDVSYNVRRDVQIETVHRRITEDRPLDLTCDYCKIKLSQSTKNRTNRQLTPARSFRSVATQTEATEVNTRDNNKCDVCLEEASSKPECVEKPPDQIKRAKAARKHKENIFCAFCFKNGEPPKIYFTHVTKNQNGVVVCPVLREYVCRVCGATGDNAHTRKYCRIATNQNAEEPIFRRLTNGAVTMSNNHK